MFAFDFFYQSIKYTDMIRLKEIKIESIFRVKGGLSLLVGQYVVIDQGTFF